MYNLITRQGMEREEEEDRAIAAASMALGTKMTPDVSANIGPGMLRGPLRFLPPGKRIHLWRPQKI